MQQNIQLLLILSAAVGLVLGMSLFLIARRPPRSPVLRSCGIGLLMLGAAVAAMSTRHVAPAYFSIVGANTLIAAAIVIFFSATRHLEKRQPSRPDYTGWLLVVLIAMLFTWYTYPAPDMAMRIVLMNGAAAFLVGRVALNLTRYALSPRGATDTLILSAMLWFLTIVLAITSIFTAISGEPSQDLFQASVPVATLMVVNPLLILLIPLTAWFSVRRAQHKASRHYVHRSREESRAGRDAFMHRCDQAAARAQQEKQPLVFAMVDLDNFKQTADEHGFPVVNQVLKWVEEQIVGSLRVGDELTRFSVDRFAILLPHMEQSKALLELDTLRKRIEVGTCTVDGIPIKTTVSIGVAQSQPGRTNAKELASAAQLAIYRARRGGRNRIDAAGDTYTGFDMTEIDRR